MKKSRKEILIENRVKKFVKNCRWLNHKNAKHLVYYSCAWDSEYARAEHKCPLTGEKAMYFIQHKRMGRKTVIEGISLKAIKMIEKEIGCSLKEV